LRGFAWHEEQYQKLRAQGTYSKALPHAFGVLEAVGRAEGTGSRRYATRLHDLAMTQADAGFYSQAVVTFRKVIALREKMLGAAHPEVTASRIGLADVLLRGKEYDDPDLLQQLLRAQSHQGSPEDRRQPLYAITLRSLGALFADLGDCEVQGWRFDRALSILERTYGKNHPEVATTLQWMAFCFIESGELGQAERLLNRAKTIREDRLGVEHPEVAATLDLLSRVASKRGDPDRAAILLRKALSIASRKLGEDHPAYALYLSDMAAVHWNRQNPNDAVQSLLRAQLSIEKRLGGTNRFSVNWLKVLVRFAQERGDSAAEARYQRSLLSASPRWKRWETRMQKLQADLGTAASRYLALVQTGNYLEAISAVQSALESARALFGEEDMIYATQLGNLGYSYNQLGQHRQAEKSYLGALSIIERILGTTSLRYAIQLLNLADLYSVWGNLVHAEALYVQALQVIERSTAAQGPLRAIALLNASRFPYARKELLKAEGMMRQAIRTLEQHQTEEGVASQLGSAYSNLSVLLVERGKLQDARTWAEKALVILERTHGKEHPLLSNPITALGSILRLLREPQKAEELLLRALALLRKRLPDQHELVGTTLGNLAIHYAENGDLDRSWQYAKPAMASRLDDLYRQLPSLYPREQDAYVNEYVTNLLFNANVVVRLAERKPRAADRLARDLLEQVIGFKGLLLSTLQTQRASALAARDGKLGDLLQARTAAVRRYSASQQKEAGESDAFHRRRLQEATDRLALAEQRLARATGDRIQKLQRTTVDEVISSLGTDEALVEFLRYPEYLFSGGPRKSPRGPDRYLALVVRGGGSGRVSLVSLGPAQPLESTIRRYQNANQEAKRYQVQSLDLAIRYSRNASQALYNALINPLHRHLAGVKTSWLSLDGALSLVPLSTLEGPDSRRWEERMVVNVVESAQHLVQLKRARRDRDSATPGVAGQITAVALVAPDFGSPILGAPVRYPPLKWSADDSSQLSTLLDQALRKRARRPGASVRVELSLGRQASRARLMAVQRPRILHLFTHGEYRPSPATAPSIPLSPRDQGGGLATLAGGEQSMESSRRSGVALAGANLGTSDPEKTSAGFVSALEVGVLDLTGTDLVVIGACESGIGELRDTQGVFGLRRAFLYAGARTLLVSLWKVPEVETKFLLSAFYEGLVAGLDKREALLAAQKKVRTTKNPLPFYWAGFVLVGDAD
jgi:CHAT domain-containing protein